MVQLSCIPLECIITYSFFLFYVTDVTTDYLPLQRCGMNSSMDLLHWHSIPIVRLQYYYEVGVFWSHRRTSNADSYASTSNRCGSVDGGAGGGGSDGGSGSSNSNSNSSSSGSDGGGWWWWRALGALEKRGSF
ncbi:hypothetical protein M0804_007933 [Polistes exclamans]|nr:hypothetical protein M0804_007933 [Polistes exclamans]